MTSIRVHLGAAKTGTTALQRVLGRNAETLRTAGVWYPTSPPFVLAESGIAKHQPLVRLVREGSPRDLERWVTDLVAAAPSGCRLIALSAEGLWRHSGSRPDDVDVALRAIGRAGAASGVLVWRDVPDLQASLYKQAVRNPGHDGGTSTSLTMVEWLTDPAVAALWAVDRFVDSAQDALGGPVDVLRYGPDIVPRTWRSLTHDSLAYPEDDLTSGRANRSLSDDAAELLRLATPALAPDDRRLLVAALARSSGAPAGATAALHAVSAADVQPACGRFRPTAAGVDQLRNEMLDA